jgi:diacylglycerol O-acyltransferase
MPIERLSREDRFMLWPDRRWPQVNGALLRLEASGLPGLDGLRAAVGRRLAAVPRFRQVLWVPPRRLGGPLWIDDQRFDIATHVRESRVPGPAGEQELLATVDELWCKPLDPAHPLWGMWLLTGLPDGEAAVFVKIHHAIADGLAATATLAEFLDAAPGATPPAPMSWVPAPPPSKRALLVTSLRDRASGLKKALRPVTHPARTARAVRAAWPALREILTDKALPPTSLDGMVTSGHNLAAIRTTLEEMKGTAHANDATVNDVLLELIGAGLRQLLGARHELEPGMIVRVSVPVSLRLSERAHARGNLISEMVVPIPVGERDPVARLRSIAAETALRKQLRRPSIAVMPMNRLCGPLVLSAVRRQRVNVASTNVPGPEQPLYLAGARVRDVFPLMPLIGNQPLAVAAMSYAGQFNVMVIADRALVPDLGVFAEAVRLELAALGSPRKVA